MKRILAFFVMICMILPLTASAEAAEVRYSNRFWAVNLAQHALAEKYGIAEGMNECFDRLVAERDDGTYLVTWEPVFGDAAMTWLLGTYTAVVSGEEVSISWTHDGEDTNGGYDAPAWGADQLSAMADEVRTTFSMSEPWDAAERSAYAGRVGYPFSGAESGFDNSRRDEALAAAAITPAEADAAARLALREICGSLEWWRLETADGESGWNVGYLNGRPVIVIHYDLWGQGNDEWEWQPGDGTYEVTVNLATGEIEEILYRNGLSGNG